MAARKNDKRKYPANAVHYPHRNGTLCGLTGREAPTDARSYTIVVEDLTCPYCEEHQGTIEAWGAQVARQQQSEARQSKAPKLPPIAASKE